MNSTVAIIGGESLLGREVRELLEASSVPADVKLIGTGDKGVGIIEQEDEEAVLMTPLEEEYVAGVRAAVFAGSQASTVKAFEMMSRFAENPAMIDLTYALEERPNARLRAPAVEPAGYAAPEGSIHVMAHPAAVALAQFFGRLEKKYPVRRSVVQIFEPASERGQIAIEELQKQTVSLLSFKALKKDVFDAQLSFNMLPRYGSEAPVKLEEVELRIERHLASLLAMSGKTPMPSLRLAQAPVFHGYTFSIWAELAERPSVEQLAEALACVQIEVRSADHEPATNVGAAGQSGLTAGNIELDRNHPRGVWFWVVADNFRIAAEGAVDVVRSVFERGDKGSVA